jgi:hypothetical protein
MPRTRDRCRDAADPDVDDSGRLLGIVERRHLVDNPRRAA